MMILRTCMEQKPKVTGPSTSSFSLSSSPSSSSSSSSPPTTPSKLQAPPSFLSSTQRWTRQYDLLVCHSLADSDIEEAKRLVSFLEASPCSLRCFLWQRDVCVGGAVPTEFCQAVQESHMQALLITPNFLQEEWCKYMMHQVLAEGPMSNRLIPLIKNLPHSQYPHELKFYIYINLNYNTDKAYTRISMTVFNYLENLVKNERAHEHSMDSSSGADGGEASSGADELIPDSDSAETSIPVEEMHHVDEHL
ncbi:toll/interleukin-1 receptor domain-containing adapter protein isoform X2 [Echeneis naucrates]|uniref:toll/interleukin-1 receptor domain-containing adapter protein isoform X2 n=1 Tax=Echeneis naucrates TaxID=173247 RepID=UPI00111336AE|nr:toll/interleukin-1 receptor domain-containing adapter protein isoform X2 [Echeneis naucrates]